MNTVKKQHLLLILYMSFAIAAYVLTMIVFIDIKMSQNKLITLHQKEFQDNANSSWITNRLSARQNYTRFVETISSSLQIKYHNENPKISSDIIGPFKTLTGEQIFIEVGFKNPLIKYFVNNLFLTSLMIAVFLIFFLMKPIKFMKNFHHEYDSLVEKSKFISLTRGVAHDLRKPFDLVQLLLSNLMKKIHDPSILPYLTKGYEEIDYLISNADQMLSDLIDFDNEPKWELRDLDVEECIKFSIDQSFEYVFKETHKNFQISVNCTESQLVFGNFGVLARVFSNLITNAIQFIDVDGYLGISVKDIVIDEKSFTQIIIGNSGPMIPDDVKRRLFKLNETSGKEGGTGLGLYNSKKIIEFHSGTIELLDSIDNYTRFIINLPNSENTKSHKSRFVFPSTSNKYYERLNDEKIDFMWIPFLRKINQKSIFIAVLTNDVKKFNRYCSKIESVTPKALQVDYELFKNEHTLLKCEGSKFNIILVDYEFPNIDILKLEKVKDQLLLVTDDSVLNYKIINASFDRHDWFSMMKYFLLGSYEESIPESSFALNDKNDSDSEIKAQILVVDDDGFILESWYEEYGENISLYHSPDGLFEEIANKEFNLNGVKYIVLDFYYNNSKFTGREVVKKLREMGLDKDCKVFLSTSMPKGTISEVDDELFDEIIKKEVVDF